MAGDLKKTYVIDASFALAFLLSEKNLEVDKVFSEYKNNKFVLISNDLLNYEVGNALRTAVLRKRLNNKKAQELFQAFVAFEIKEENVDFLATLGLAVNRKISFYDASYLYLAKKLKTKLLTLDSSLL